MTTGLPIEPVLPRLRAALASHQNVVLQAPPGAGKTTLVPLAVLHEHWLGGRNIVMLEPRRLATRAAAHRLAALHGDTVGDTIGYRMRGEQRVGRHTRVEVVTEGILTRRLQNDPTLERVGLVIFDEFHERSLNADLGLALALRTQQLVRDDLRILVMSATLDGEAVAALLGGAPIVTSEGRSYPVDTRYVERRPEMYVETAVANAVVDTVRREPGDVLVFLPGAREIRRVESQLAARDLDDTVDVLPLHGTLAQPAQERAVRPAPAGRRKIVLATSIAETSLTIEGVRVVIDSGQSRIPRFSPRSGMTRLETVRVSRASAEQRRGRAGRLAPGVCIRLWPEHEQLIAQSPPEILGADLAPLALDLAVAGVLDPAELRWLDIPPIAAFAQARELLRELEAIDERGLATAHGRRMGELPVHPRLAHMLLRAVALGLAPLACEIAALLEDRDILRGDSGPPDPDLTLRIDAVRGARSTQVDGDGLRRARHEAERLARHLGIAFPTPDARPPTPETGTLLALAYPDRIGQRRAAQPGRFLLRNGRGALIADASPLARSEYVVAADLDDQRPESRVFIAASLEESDLRDQFASQIITEQVVEWNAETESVVARERERLGALVLRDVTVGRPDSEAVRAVLLDEIRRRGLTWLPWPEAAQRLRSRIAFLAGVADGWPDVSDDALTARLDEWLAPLVPSDARRLGDVVGVDLVEAVRGLLTWEQRTALDTLAPTHIALPAGPRIAIDYSNPSAPVLAARIQDVFGLADTPRIAGGRVPLTMHLLSPARRPVQVTQDLASFWRTSYFDVRKDLRGRYPKHDWPENPLKRSS